MAFVEFENSERSNTLINLNKVVYFYFSKLEDKITIVMDNETDFTFKKPPINFVNMETFKTFLRQI